MMRERMAFWNKLLSTSLQLSMYSSRNARLVHVSPQQNKSPNNLKGKSKSSQEWITRQLNDPYVKRAHEQNYRARSAFKLIEIDEKAKILRPGQIVVECGAAPGAWTQVIIERINSDGKVPKKRIGIVIGIDLLPIAPLNGAHLLGGCDFTSAVTQKKVQEILGKRLGSITGEPGLESATIIQGDNGHVVELNENVNVTQNVRRHKFLVDLVLSDMAPNATGQRDTDHSRIVKLVEKALEFSVENGKIGGHFLAKLWDGSETKRLENQITAFYEKVSRIKPPSSRNDSSEFFILGKYKK